MVERIPTLAAGAGTFVLGMAVGAMSPRSRIHRAFALFCLARGGMLALRAFSSPVDDLAGRLSVYFMLAIPFTAAWLAYAVLRRDRRQGRWDVRLGGSLLTGACIAEGLYVFDHGLYFSGFRPLAMFHPLQFVSYAGVAFAIAWTLRRETEGPRRRSLYPLSLGFAAEPAFYSAFNFYDWFITPSWSPGNASRAALLATAGVLVVASAAQMAGSPRHDRNRFMGTLGAAIATGVAGRASLLAGPSLLGPVHVLFFLNAGWTLFLVATAAYAIVRYRLFTIDLRVKHLIRHGSTAFVEGLIFVVLSALLEDVVASRGVSSVIAALVVAAGLYPVSRVTRRFAERLMPGVADDDDYRARRRLDIYRAALHQAWRDGEITPDEKHALEVLWKGLGIPSKEARVVEGEVIPSRSGTA